jgi:hypothetical protein
MAAVLVDHDAAGTMTSPRREGRLLLQPTLGNKEGAPSIVGEEESGVDSEEYGADEDDTNMVRIGNVEAMTGEPTVGEAPLWIRN